MWQRTCETLKKTIAVCLTRHKNHFARRFKKIVRHSRPKINSRPWTNHRPKTPQNWSPSLKLIPTPYLMFLQAFYVLHPITQINMFNWWIHDDHAFGTNMSNLNVKHKFQSISEFWNQLIIIVNHDECTHTSISMISTQLPYHTHVSPQNKRNKTKDCIETCFVFE